MDPTSIDPVRDFGGIALALALGLLVGLERGWATRDHAPGTRFAGIRTYGLFGLAGGLAGALHERAGALALVLLAAAAALVVAGYWRASVRQDERSGTASLVGLLTLACGYLAASGEGALASAVTGATVVVLSQRKRLHGWVSALSEAEMVGIARFALIALVILPLLPDTPFGPFDAWRPRQLWLVVVLVSGFSFAGYLASRRFGETRGILATSAAGAMVSSTAVTAALAAKLRDDDGDPAVLAAGVALASAVMFARIGVLAFALARFALPTFLVLGVPSILASLLATVWLLRRRGSARAQSGSQVAVRNPFGIGPALLLMGLVMVLSVVARWVLANYGDEGLALVLAVTGSVDTDSAIITMGNLPPGALDPRTAGLVMLPPLILNTLLKAGIALTVPGWRKGWPMALPLIATAAAPFAALPFVL